MSDEIKTVEEVTEEAFKEGVDAVTLDELSEKEEVTVEDLREWMGDDAKDLSDEELQELYAKVSEESEAGDEAPKSSAEGESTEEEGSVEWDREWQALSGDEALAAEKARELLDLKVTYKAGEKEQKATLDELVRIAQRVPLESSRVQTLIQQRNTVDQQLREAQAEVEQAKKDRELWMRAIQDPTGQLFEQIREQFQQELLTGIPTTQAQPAQPTTFSEAENQQGELIFQTQVRPYLQQLAASYKDPQQEMTPQLVQGVANQLEQAARQLIANEGRFLEDPVYGPQRFNEILAIDLPKMLESAGFQPITQSTQPAQDGLTSKERAELESLRKAMAAQKVKEAPDAGGGSPANAAGGEIKLDVDSLSAAKDLLHSDFFEKQLK